LAPSDFHLFQTLKEFLSGRHFKSNAEEKDVIKEWLNGLVAEVYDQGIQKPVTRYDRSLKVDGDYVEKYLRVGNSDILNLFLLFIFLHSQTVFTFWMTLVHRLLFAFLVQV